MKRIYINKAGYSIGQYGCSNEYFNCVVINKTKVIGFTFSGMYGAEYRVSKALQDKGFSSNYIPLNIYGKLTAKEGKNAYSEHTVIANIDELLKHGYIEFNKTYRTKAGLKPVKN